MHQPLSSGRRHAGKGFTLIELLVAIAIMALMAILGWRGLDGMARTQTLTRERADEVLALQAGLSQWRADLDAMAPIATLPGIDWDGRVLRLLRAPAARGGEGMLVVAWTRRNGPDGGQWLRWQSPPLTQRGDLQQAWLQAAVWAQNPGEESRKREVMVTALDEWQVFYYRGDAWSNPLSSDGSAGTASTSGVSSVGVLPDGVRVVLTRPASLAAGGKLTMDWIRPVLGGGKS